MISIRDISYYIVNKCIDEGYAVNNMRLQQILYKLQVEHLKQNDSRVFPEYIEAWKFGPVAPMAYYRFCYYGSFNITDKFDSETLKIDWDRHELDKGLIDKIIEQCGPADTIEINKDITRAGSAYDKVYADGKGEHKIISPELMRKCG